MDVTINPRLISVSAMLRHVRKGQVVKVHKRMEGEAELMEILVSENSKVANKKINKLHIPSDALVGAILRNGEMVVPNGETVLEAGDSVILVTLPHSIDKVEKIFAGKHLF
jgi:trk system potassium uptake protein TrkA